MATNVQLDSSICQTWFAQNQSKWAATHVRAVKSSPNVWISMRQSVKADVNEPRTAQWCTVFGQVNKAPPLGGGGLQELKLTRRRAAAAKSERRNESRSPLLEEGGGKGEDGGRGDWQLRHTFGLLRRIGTGRARYGLCPEKCARVVRRGSDWENVN